MSLLTRMLNSLTQLTASKSAKFEEGLDVNSQKITNAGSGVLSSDGINLGQLTALSSSLISVVNAGDTAFQNNLNSVSGAIVDYALAQDNLQYTASVALSSSIKSYVDAADSAQDIATGQLSSSLKSYIDVADSAVSSSLKTYIDAADLAQDTATGQLSSSIKSYVDAADSAQDIATGQLSSSIKSYVDAADSAQDAATGQLSSSIKSYVDAANSAQDTLTDQLSSSISSAIASEATARATEDLTLLKIDGSRAMSGSLNMGGQDIVSANSGSFSGDVTVGGNLQVNGGLTSINTDSLQVTDKLVTIAKGAVNGAAANGAGIEVDGASASLVYDNNTGKWVSNIGLKVNNEAAFDAAIKLSGSAFTNITTPIADGKFDVSDAIHALDTKVGSNSTSLVEAYDSLRQVITGTIDTGSVAVDLTFATSDINSVALDVMVDEGVGYKNDLVSAKMSIINSKINVRVDAPVTPVGSLYRIIAINAKKGGLSLIGGGGSTLLIDLARYYKLDGDGIDSVSGANATITGDGFEAGKMGQGFNFAGSTGRAIVAPAFNPLGDFSVSFWTKKPSGSGGSFAQAIGQMDGGWGEQNWTILVAGPGLTYYARYNREVNGISINPFNNEWAHIVFTRTGNTIKGYLNGVLQFTNTDPGNAPYSVPSAQLRMGTRNDFYSGYEGSMDEVALWTRAITDAEVVELYNGGTGKAYPF